MQSDSSTSSKVRCHRCSHYLGETAVEMELVGVVKERDIHEMISHPRSSWKCKCGWTNVYKPMAKVA